MTTIEHITAEDVPFLFMRRTIPAGDMDAIQNALGACFGAVYAFMGENGITPAAPPTVRYADMNATSMTLEAGFPVQGAPTPGEDMHLGVLPGGEHARALHVGPYDTLPGTYNALQKWIGTHHRTPGGAPWETYLTDPGAEPNASKWETAVSWPLAPRTEM